MLNPQYRECKSCRKTKPATTRHFYRNGTNLRCTCIECLLASRRKTDKRHVNRRTVNGLRQCAGCGYWLEANTRNFHRNGKHLQIKCKWCRNEEHGDYQRKKAEAVRDG